MERNKKVSHPANLTAEEVLAIEMVAGDKELAISTLVLKALRKANYIVNEGTNAGAVRRMCRHYTGESRE